MTQDEWDYMASVVAKLKEFAKTHDFRKLTVELSGRVSHVDSDGCFVFPPPCLDFESLYPVIKTDWEQNHAAANRKSVNSQAGNDMPPLVEANDEQAPDRVLPYVQ